MRGPHMNASSTSTDNPPATAHAVSPHLYVGQTAQHLHPLLWQGSPCLPLALGGQQLAVLAHSFGVPPRPCIRVCQPQLVLLVRGIFLRQQRQLVEGNGWVGMAAVGMRRS